MSPLTTYKDFLSAEASRVRTLIEQGKLDTALHVIYKAVEHVFTEPLCAGEIFGSPDLDALCTDIGERLFATLTPPAPAKNDTPLYVYIATRLQRSGGHTRVLRDYIQARPEARHVILLTGSDGPSDIDWLQETFREVPGYSLEQGPCGTPTKMIRWLQERLVILAPTHTYLFNHHADAAAASAVVPAMKLPASFCHHGDHQLCLGMHLPHLTHIDFHPMGYHCCRDALGITHNRYIPLMIPDLGGREPIPFMANGTLTTATAAGANKLEAPYPIRYVDIIPALLAAAGGTHIHIGQLSKRGLARIRQGLKARGVAQERFVYMPWVDSVWRELVARGVDLYIGSFPYGGGLTLIETMGAGIPSVSHRHLRNRAFSGLDIAYPGAFTWRTPEELFIYCKQITPEILAKQSTKARAHYLSYHQRSMLPELLDGRRDIIPPPLAPGYSPATDEWTRWSTQMQSLRYTLRKFAYRRYRRWRHFKAMHISCKARTA